MTRRVQRGDLWEAFADMVWDVIAEGIYLVDATGRTVLYNAAASQLEGLEPEEVLGKHLLEVFPSLTETSSTLLTVLKTGKPILGREQTYSSFKGKMITTVNSSLPVIKDGKVLGAFELSQDVTRVVEMSKRIVDLQARLVDKRSRKRPSKGTWARYTLDDIITENAGMLRLKSVALRAARSDSSVIIYGETGTGKEFFAHSLHNAGPRRGMPFVAQNCSAIPANLLESILFGTVKGSFTGAQDREGLFELANGGTLFLDEINSMPLDLQPKILRVLQDGRVRRVGAIDEIPVNVRVITSANADPMLAVERQILREDLYYRIAVISLGIPPLRERRDDVPILVEHFIDKLNDEMNLDVRGVSPEVLGVFARYPWPGNVRELEHAIRGSMSIMEGDVINMGDLPPPLIAFWRKPADTEYGNRSLKQSLRALEKRMIKEALGRCQGKVSGAAEALGIPRQTLQSKIKRLGL